MRDLLDDQFYRESIATQREMIAQTNLTNRDRVWPDEAQPYLREMLDVTSRMLWVCWMVERKARTGEPLP